MEAEGPVHLVTGAGGALGRGVVAALAARGGVVVGADRSASAPGSGESMWWSGLDFLEPSSCDALAKRVLDAFGRIDGVAHAVGGFKAAGADEGGPELWDEMFRLNLLTTLNVFRACLPSMRAAGRGALVAVGAAAADRAPARLGAYAASKAGVLRLVEAFAAEAKADGVRVNAVLPGTMDTPKNRADMPRADVSRWVGVEEVAEGIAFLLSDAASGVTGAAVPIYGRG